jgi:DNA-binding beta-propeller fold protein YncE
MRKMVLASTFACAVSAAALAWGAPGYVPDRAAVQEFTRLPDGVHFPEGIAANPATGEIYVATFDFGGNNQLLRFRPSGKLAARKVFGATPLLGLAFGPVDGKVYICNAGDLAGAPYVSKIQRIAADFDNATDIEDVALIPHVGDLPDRTVDNPDGSQDTIHFGTGAAAPNAIAFRSDGSLFVSDSFQGAVFQVDNPDLCAGDCPVTTFLRDSLLATAGFPPFGANGIAFSPDETALFIANTGDDRILRLTTGTMALEVFAESVNGADGIAFDPLGRLWVAANQADEIAVLDDNGRVIEKLGDFLGIGKDGAPRGLLFPASIVFSRGQAFVTNLALPLTAATGDEPEEDVRVYTIAQLKAPGPRRGGRR